MDIVLASSSLRRQELLKRIVDDFKIIVSNFDEESIAYGGDIRKYVKDLALGKANNVMNSIKKHSIIIGCDTVVYHNDKILGKPKDKKEAFYMLKSLSGGVHKVYSGIAVINTFLKTKNVDYVCTEVSFSKLSDDEIYKYIDSFEWIDKAGAYGIQGKAGIFVEKIHGCYYNVVGLPLNRLYNMLKMMGVNL